MNTNRTPSQVNAEAGPAGRRSIDRDTLLQAALVLVGPHRSISTLSLREIAREAGIAPNSFYRHFRDTDELAVALIDSAGAALRRIFSEARRTIGSGRSVTRMSVEIFMSQLDADDQLLPLLLREGTVGSAAFKQAVERQLRYFEDELLEDMVRLEELQGHQLTDPRLAARAITRLTFTMGASALDQQPAERAELVEQTAAMVRMIIRGAQKNPAADQPTRIHGPADKP